MKLFLFTLAELMIIIVFHMFNMQWMEHQLNISDEIRFLSLWKLKNWEVVKIKKLKIDFDMNVIKVYL